MSDRVIGTTRRYTQQQQQQQPGQQRMELQRSTLQGSPAHSAHQHGQHHDAAGRAQAHYAADGDIAAIDSDEEQDAPSSSPADAAQHQPEQPPKASTSGHGGGQSWGALGPLMLAALPALALLALFLKHRRRQQRQPDAAAPAATPAKSAPSPQPAPTLHMFASELQLPAPAATEGTTQPLQALRVAVSEHIAVAGAVTGCGVPTATTSQQPASTSAPVVEQLLAQGSDIVGQASIQPLNSPEPLGLNIRNPAAQRRAAGGGGSGGAAAVASGSADVAVGTDYLGSVRVPAACMGLYGFVSTAGALDWHMPEAAATAHGPAATAAGSPAGSAAAAVSQLGTQMESVGFIARETGFLCRVAHALGLPGSPNLKHEVTQVVVAEDLFGLCEPEMQLGIAALKNAIVAWAGQEQAGSVQLLPFLSSGTARWMELLTPEQRQQQQETQGGGGAILLALTKAAETLHRADLWARYEGVLSRLGGQEAGASEEGQGGDGVSEELTLARRAAEAGGQLTAQEVQLAKEVAAEVQDILRGAVKKDVIVVVPVLPSAAPLFDAPPQRHTRFTRRCLQFACIPALGGCPCVTMPAGRLPDGAPLSVALFGLQRTDQRLLAVADKLAPLTLREFDALLERKRQQQEEQQGKQGQEAAGASAAGSRSRRMGSRTSDSAASAGLSSKRSSSGGGAAAAAAAAAPASPPDPKRVERAEKAKARGNELFKAGKYLEAVKEYTKAIQQHPNHAVYYSNRAMAYLKAFHFELAEADCDRALTLAEGDSDRVKALLRRGTARMHLYKADAAAKDFAAVLATEPNNRQAREELRALRQQQAELVDAQRKAQQQAGSSGRGSSGGGGVGANGFHLPHGMMGMMEDGMGAAEDGPGAGMMGAGAGDAGGLMPEEYAAMMDNGQVPMLLGPDGQPLAGPNGEPIVVLPDGQAIMVGQDGQTTPIDLPMDYGAGAAAAGGGGRSLW